MHKDITKMQRISSVLLLMLVNLAEPAWGWQTLRQASAADDVVAAANWATAICSGRVTTRLPQDRTVEQSLVLSVEHSIRGDCPPTLGVVAFGPHVDPGQVLVVHGHFLPKPPSVFVEQGLEHVLFHAGSLHDFSFDEVTHIVSSLDTGDLTGLARSENIHEQEASLAAVSQFKTQALEVLKTIASQDRPVDTVVTALVKNARQQLQSGSSTAEELLEILAPLRFKLYGYESSGQLYHFFLEVGREDIVLEGLNSTNLAARVGAAVAATSPEVTPALIDALALALGTETDYQGIMAIGRALASNGRADAILENLDWLIEQSPAAIDLLRTACRESNTTCRDKFMGMTSAQYSPQIRLRAWRALEEMCENSGCRDLDVENLALDVDRVVRSRQLQALATFEPRSATVKLLTSACLEDDPSAFVAAWGLLWQCSAEYEEQARFAAENAKNEDVRKFLRNVLTEWDGNGGRHCQ